MGFSRFSQRLKFFKTKYATTAIPTRNIKTMMPTWINTNEPNAFQAENRWTSPRVFTVVTRNQMSGTSVGRSLAAETSPEVAQMLAPLDDGQEVVAGQLAQLTGEHGGAVGKQDLRLAVSTGIEQDLPRRGVAGVILEAHAHLEVAQRNPGSLAAPAGLNDLVAKRQQRLERRACLRRVLLFKACPERQRAGRDA